MQSKFWDKRAKKYEEKATQHGPKYLKTIGSTLRLLTEADVVLDIGCGSGEICFDMATKVARMEGVDTSGVMIEMANQKARYRKLHNVSFTQADIFDSSFHEGAYSVVTVFNMLHLVEDMSGIMERIYRLLSPGGLFISETPCLQEQKWIFRKLVGFAQITGLAPPIKSLKFNEVSQLMESSGFEIIEDELWDLGDAVQRVVARKPEQLSYIKAT